jgi:transcription elongation GreA/GreB family factor
MSDHDALESYDSLTNTTQRRRFIEQLKQTQPERWPALAVRLFLSGKDRRIRTWLETELGRNNPDAWQKLLAEVVTGYRQNPDAFLWLLGNSSRFGSQVIAGAVKRAIDLLESTAFRKLWPRLRHTLANEQWQLLGLALAEADLPAAKHLLARIRKLTLLAPYEKDEISAVFASRFPELVQEKKEDAILSTAAGIGRARQELAKLVQEEIPRSAEEIGRARAHGDLSENYEFKAAKEKQARLMLRAGKLKLDLVRARPISREDVDPSIVSVGCRVKLEDSAGIELEYTFLGPWDSDPDHGVVSYLAPLGQKLLGRKPGESVELDARVLTVKEITPAPL